MPHELPTSNPSPPLLDTSPARLPGLEPLVGQHVRLERLEAKHHHALYGAVGSDDEMWKFVADGPFASETQWGEFLTSAAAGETTALYAVITLHGQVEAKEQPSGIVAVMATSLANRVIELGSLYGPGLRRSTAATETMYLVARMAFEELGCRRLEWRCHDKNERSKVAAERYGFVFEGRLRQHMILKGANRDSCFYSILDGEWSLCKTAFEAWLADDNFDAQGWQRKGLKELRADL